jgi:hypothetical protein
MCNEHVECLGVYQGVVSPEPYLRVVGDRIGQVKAPGRFSVPAVEPRLNKKRALNAYNWDLRFSCDDLRTDHHCIVYENISLKLLHSPHETGCYSQHAAHSFESPLKTHHRPCAPRITQIGESGYQMNVYTSTRTSWCWDNDLAIV